MQPYQPFLIAPFASGLVTDVEPWLAPQDAFTEIVNGHIHHGFLQKRPGYTELNPLVHGLEISAASNATPAVFTVSDTSAMTTGDTVNLHYLAGGTWNTLNSAEYIITVASGTTFTLESLSGTAIDGSGLGTYTANSGRVGYSSGDRVMGIFTYIDSAGVRLTLVGDTKRYCLLNSATDLFQPLDLYDGSTAYPDDDHMASTSTDYIWAANWQHSGSVNRVYMTNGKAYVTASPGTDGILYYDASAAQVVQFRPDLDGGTTTLNGCRMMFVIKQRLFCLYTYENTSVFPQRVTWCAQQNPGNWDRTVAGGGGFVDAPTGDHIISARQVHDTIIVFFTNSVWTLTPQSDPALPIRWTKVNDFRACDGRMATVGYDRYALSAGIRGITASDGVETRRIDQRIQDFTSDEINADQFDKSYGERDYSNERTWLLYADETSDDANAALIYDEESQAYSIYDIDMNVLGQGINSTDLAAEDFVEANNLDYSADDFDEENALSFYWSKAADLFLGGDRSGVVHRMGIGVTDNGTEYAFSAKSSAWNPYKEQSMEAQMGYIDFYVTADQNTEFTVKFFKNDDETPYSEQAVDCLPNLDMVSTISDVVIASDPTNGMTITSYQHGLTEGDTVYFYRVNGGTWLNDQQWTVGATVGDDSFTIDSDITTNGTAITGASAANPCVITAASHGLKAGDVVTIVDITGMVELNGNTYTVANPTTDTFELSGIDSSAYTAYGSGGYVFKAWTSGGVISKQRIYRTRCWKRAYAGGVGYQHRIEIEELADASGLVIHAFKPWFRPRAGRVLG